MTQREIQKRFNRVIIILALAAVLVALESIEPSTSPSGAATADVPEKAAAQALCKNTCSDICDADESCLKECREHFCPRLAKEQAITAITGII